MSVWSYLRGTWGTWEWDIGLLRVEFVDFPGLRSGRKVGSPEVVGGVGGRSEGLNTFQGMWEVGRGRR